MHAAGFANIATSQRSDDGLVLADAYIAAAVRCAPPDNKPTPLEIAACHPHLVAEAAALTRVRVIVALGRSRSRLRGDCSRIGVSCRARNRCSATVSSTNSGGPVVIASYHPSWQNANTRKLTPAMLDSIFDSAARIARGRA